MSNMFFDVLGTKSSKYENQYEAKVQSQKVYINEVDRDGAQHLHELKQEKGVTIEYARVKLSSYDELVTMKEQDISKIIPQGLTREDDAKIGRWDVMMKGSLKNIDKKRVDVENKISDSQKKIVKKKRRIEEEFVKMKNLAMGGGAGD